MRRWAWTIAWLLWGVGRLSAQTTDPLDPGAVRRLRVTEVTQIGGDDLREAYVFDRIRDAAVVSSDAFVVLDGGSNEARTYGLDGIIRSKVGGKGQGPGEFASAGRIDGSPKSGVAAGDKSVKA